MARNLQPKGKQNRRLGVKIFDGGAAKAFTRRSYAPGQQGPTQRRGKTSVYGLQLKEKQVAKKLYGLLEKQFHLYYEKSSTKSGETSENFLQLLEMRLDNVVFRSGLAETRQQARQLVNHGHIQVNGKKVDIPSYQCSVGDQISVKPSKQSSKLWQEIFTKQAKLSSSVSWIHVDPAKHESKVVAKPSREDIVVPFDMRLIIEFYSK